MILTELDALGKKITQIDQGNSDEIADKVVRGLTEFFQADESDATIKSQPESVGHLNPAFDNQGDERNVKRRQSYTSEGGNTWNFICSLACCGKKIGLVKEKY